MKLFPDKKWEEMDQQEREHFLEMTEDQLTSRWDTREGESVRQQIIDANLACPKVVGYSQIVGTVGGYSKKVAPKTDLRGLDLSGFENLVDDTIVGFDFSDCNLEYSEFSDAVFTSSSFRRSNILYSNFSGSILDGCDFSGCNLTLSRFDGANLEEADLRGAWISDVSFEGANLGFVKYDRRTDFHNIDIALVRGSSNPLFTAFVRRTHFIKHYREQNLSNRLIYYIWLGISDCGQSFGRWFGVSILITALFGYLYSRMPESFYIANDRAPTPFTFYYYSVVAFTTLGFGDVIPRDLRAEILVTVQVLIGYLMLGGLISIFATKFIPKD